ncbi:hypothetical protein [Hafnia psychrotolerans]|uniref:Uncharacterized protein n=1 Tax=Hafnia psychrotolerans TaxID=1477018 RepID=A0ABQ1G842_9GAMM|nr:hypothetical protein [Hafnia psychrotolerans]GGA38566.1 hypothetical protein GCM10011328_11760 [Hafnia psychrotolerans]
MNIDAVEMIDPALLKGYMDAKYSENSKGFVDRLIITDQRMFMLCNGLIGHSFKFRFKSTGEGRFIFEGLENGEYFFKATPS